MSAHTDIIREIVEIKGFGVMTCSNDATVKVWDAALEGNLFTFNNHSSFVFTIQNLQPDSLNFVSGGDDFKVLVQEDSALSQTLQHPNTVWNLVVDYSTNEIISACADMTVRIFTKNPSKYADEADIKIFAEAGTKTSEQGAEMDAETISKFPPIADLAKHKGKSDGDQIVFNDDGVGKAYYWQNGKWEFLGEVTGHGGGKPNTVENKAGGQKYYEGDR
jgi:phospholipase A-2-activating protein